ncbi:MAG: CARDB domain-containing protein [Solirubrobacteraceae bacterium]
MLAAAAALLALAAPADATLVTCERGVAEFEARMETVPGAASMSMRFTLQARTRRPYRRVEAPGFGEWTTADPGVTRYVYTRRVKELIGPARYRVLVRFRWLDAAGTTIDRDRERSRACRQPDLRPDLELLDLWTSGPGRYFALVANTGRGEAEAFDVSMTVGDEELEPVTVDRLAAGRERVVELAGPACEPGTAIHAEADPDDLVEERSEADNQLTLACS